MADETTTEAAPAVEPGAETPPVETPPEAGGEQQESWLDTIDPKAAEEIRNLRKESGNYRTKLREYEAPFEGYDDESRGVWFRLAETYKSDPQAAAKAMQQIAEGVLTPEQAATQAENEAEEGFVTPQQLEQKFKEREEQAAQEREVERMRGEAKELGYELDSDDYFYLLFISQRNGGDLKKAHEKIEAQNQAAVDRYVEGLKNDANGTVTSPHGGGAPSEERGLTTFKEARESLEQRLAQM